MDVKLKLRDADGIARLLTDLRTLHARLCFVAITCIVAMTVDQQEYRRDKLQACPATAKRSVYISLPVNESPALLKSPAGGIGCAIFGGAEIVHWGGLEHQS